MSYHYLNASRATDPHALPNCETVRLGSNDSADCWACADAAEFEMETSDHAEHLGWWYAFLDGGLDCWSGDPVGPFASEADALKAARKSADLCEHGFDADEHCNDCDDPDMRCDQCCASMINGVYCHETGCPNSRKVKIDGEWVTPSDDECGAD